MPDGMLEESYEREQTRKNQSLVRQVIGFVGGDPGEARTLDPVIKSHLLYQLSYGVIFKLVGRIKASMPLLRCKVKAIFLIDKINLPFFLRGR